MRSLFFRIFLWFWVAVVVLALTFAGTVVTTKFTVSREHLHAFKRAVALSARAAAVSYQQLGPQGVRDLVNTGEGNYVYFFDKQLTELQGTSRTNSEPLLHESRSRSGSPGNVLPDNFLRNSGASTEKSNVSTI